MSDRRIYGLLNRRSSPGDVEGLPVFSPRDAETPKLFHHVKKLFHHVMLKMTAEKVLFVRISRPCGENALTRNGQNVQNPGQLPACRWMPSPASLPSDWRFRGLLGEAGRMLFPSISAFSIHFQLLNAMMAWPCLKARKTPWPLETSMRTGRWLGGDDENTDEAWDWPECPR
jgi:hypothetical protein